MVPAIPNRIRAHACCVWSDTSELVLSLPLNSRLMIQFLRVNLLSLMILNYSWAKEVLYMDDFSGLSV